MVFHNIEERGVWRAGNYFRDLVEFVTVCDLRGRAAAHDSGHSSLGLVAARNLEVKNSAIVGWTTPTLHFPAKTCGCPITSLLENIALQQRIVD